MRNSSPHPLVGVASVLGLLGVSMMPPANGEPCPRCSEPMIPDYLGEIWMCINADCLVNVPTDSVSGGASHGE